MKNFFLNQLNKIKKGIAQRKLMRQCVPIAAAIIGARVMGQEQFRTMVDFDEIATESIQMVNALNVKAGAVS